MRSIFQGWKPIHAADPALAVLRVPVDRLLDAILPGDERLPAGLAVQLLVADAESHHVARAGAEACGDGDDLALGPVAPLLTDAQDQRGPVGHRDVLPLAVDVDVARRTVGGYGQVAADAVGAKAEVSQWLECAELDL